MYTLLCVINVDHLIDIGVSCGNNRSWLLPPSETHMRTNKSRASYYSCNFSTAVSTFVLFYTDQCVNSITNAYNVAVSSYWLEYLSTSFFDQAISHIFICGLCVYFFASEATKGNVLVLSVLCSSYLRQTYHMTSTHQRGMKRYALGLDCFYVIFYMLFSNNIQILFLHP